MIARLLARLRPRRGRLWDAAGVVPPGDLRELPPELAEQLRELLRLAAAQMLEAPVSISAEWWCTLDDEERAAVVGVIRAQLDYQQIEDAFAANRARWELEALTRG